MPVNVTKEQCRPLLTWWFPFRQGGVETFLKNFAVLAGQQGYDTWIASTMEHGGPLAQESYGERTHFLDWSHFEQAFMGDRSCWEAVATQVISDLCQVRPTAIFLNDCRSFGYGAVRLLEQIKRYCYIVDTLHVAYPPGHEDYVRDRRVYARHLDGVVAVNKTALAEFCRSFPRLADRTEYIVYGVPATDRTAGDDPAGPLRVIYVGRLAQHQKRVRDLPVIFAELRRLGCDFRLRIVGDGEQRQELVATFQELGLTGNVEFLGFRSPDAVRRLFAEHDASLNVSDFEGTPLTVLESLRAGCVPVCSELPYTTEVIRHGENGYVCPVGDTAAFAAVLAAMRPETLRTLSRAAQASGEQYSVEGMFEKYLAFFHRLATRRPLAPWPSSTDPLWANLKQSWDFSKFNPWIPHPHPLKQAVRRVRNSLFGGRRAESNPPAAEPGDK